MRMNFQYLKGNVYDFSVDYNAINKSDKLSSGFLNKTLKLCTMVIVLRSVFHESNKYYLQVF